MNSEMFHAVRSAMKVEIKRLAEENRKLKKQFREAQREEDQEAWKRQMELYKSRTRTRYLLLAYGMFRGKSLRQIEQRAHGYRSPRPVSDIFREFLEIECPHFDITGKFDVEGVRKWFADEKAAAA